MSEVELRELWNVEYCESAIFTFDKVRVQFFANMFDHCFYESSNRKNKDKSILSYNRLEKIFWIKDALTDPDAVLKVGWDSKEKTYNQSRRVALVKNNYVVIIVIFKEKKARFITAYEIEEEENLAKILDSPNFKT
nr:hypothetical protein [uncultured Pedobacter sp.]